MTIHCRINDGFKRVLIYLLHKYMNIHRVRVVSLELLRYYREPFLQRGRHIAGRWEGLKDHYQKFTCHRTTVIYIHVINWWLSLVRLLCILSWYSVFYLFELKMISLYDIPISYWFLNYKKKTKTKKHGVLFDYRLMMLHLYFISILTF